MRYGVTDQLVEAARRVLTHAYAPYSHYRVGAALEAVDGTIHVGCNVENASYGLTICAERAAVTAAVAAGATRFRRVAIAVEAAEPAFPCGACRQVLFEFGDLEGISVGRDATVRWTLAELLPSGFGPDALS